VEEVKEGAARLTHCLFEVVMHKGLRVAVSGLTLIFALILFFYFTFSL
jgi:hypothetical protein